MCVLLGNLATKDRSLIFWIEKSAFQTGILMFEKSPKNRKFAKGLVHGFCQKINLFLTCVFLENLARKVRFLIFWREKNTFQTGIVNFEKSPRNRKFLRGQSMVLSKNRRFFTPVFQGNLATKDRFMIFWIEENDFQTGIVKFETSAKNLKFSKGLVHGFWPKIDLFLMCVCLGNLATKDRSLIFWIEKNAFQTGILMFEKSPKNRKFAKGLVHGFCQKSTFFLCVFFWEIQPQRILF